MSRSVYRSALLASCILCIWLTPSTQLQTAQAACNSARNNRFEVTDLEIKATVCGIDTGIAQINKPVTFTATFNTSLPAGDSAVFACTWSGDVAGTVNHTVQPGVVNTQILTQTFTTTGTKTIQFAYDGPDWPSEPYTCEGTVTTNITVVDIDDLTLTETLHTINTATTGDSTVPDLFACQSTDGGADLEMSCTWLPSTYGGANMRWQIRTATDAAASDWNITDGTFASQPVSLTWTDPGTDSANRKFKVTAWYDCNQDGAFSSDEVNRVIKLTLCDVNVFTVTDAAYADNNQTDSTDSDSDAPTLYIDQSTSSSVSINAALSRLPTDRDWPNYRWNICNDDGESGTSGWAATDGEFSSTTTTLTWTQPTSTACRKYKMYAYYDCDRDDTYDSNEPHRLIRVVVVKITLDPIDDICDKDCKKGTSCSDVYSVSFEPSPVGKEFEVMLKRDSGSRGEAKYSDDTDSQIIAADASSPQDFTIEGREGSDTDNNMLWYAYFNNHDSVSEPFTVVEITDITNSGLDPIPPFEGSKSTNSVSVYPSTRTVQWEWLAGTVNYGCEWDTSAGTMGIIKMASTNDYETDGGWDIDDPVVKYRAYITGAASNCCYVKAQISVKCPCGCGTTFATLDSIRFGTHLGVGLDGRSMAALYVAEDLPSQRLATPACLNFHTSGPGVETFRDSAGIRQIRVPQMLVNVVVSNQFRYRLDFYLPSAITGSCTEGWYLLNGEPYRTCIVENPDGTNSINRLLWIEQTGARAATNLFVYAEPEQKWALWEGNGQRLRNLTTTTNSLGDKIETRTTLDSRSNVVAQSSRQMHQFPWGQELVESAIDPAGINLRTTRIYCQDPTRAAQYGRLEFVLNPDGGWNRFEYGTNGLTAAVFSPWCDQPTSAPPALCHATYLDYSPLDPTDVPESLDVRPRTVTVKALNTVVTRTFHVYATNALGERIEITEQAYSPTAAYGDTNNLRTTTVYYAPDEPADLAGRLARTLTPDGQQTEYFYEHGSYVTNADPALCTFVPGAGNYRRTTVTHATREHTNGIPFQTTRETTVANSLGQTVLTETYVRTSSSYDRIAWTVTELDEMGRAIAQRKSDGSLTEARWACCGKEWEQDDTGQERTFLYDALKRQDMTVKHAATNIITTYSFDAAGRTLSERISAGDLWQVSSNFYNAAGQLTGQVDKAGLTTSYQTMDGGRVSQTVGPGNATNITERFPDGRTKASHGNATIPTCYAYGVDPDGNQWTIVYTGLDGTNSRLWQKTTTDMLGRTIREERPAFGGGVLTNLSQYNAKGQLVRRTEPGKAATLQSYDELGRPDRTALDVDADNAIDLAGPDQVTESLSFYENPTGTWHHTTISVLHPQAGSATPVTNAISRERLTGLGTQTPGLGLLRAENVTLDIRGSPTVYRSYISRADRLSIDLIQSPTSTNNARTETIAGLITTKISSTGVKTEYAYDLLERMIETRTPSGDGARRVGTRTHYNARGQVDWTEDRASNRTAYAYDSAGRLTAVTNAAGNTTLTAYNAAGRIIATWGATYPVAYEFDAYGRGIAMATTRNPTNDFAALAAQLVAGQSLRSLASLWALDLTQWLYDEATGLLTNKLYADAKGPAYTYTPQGQLATRTWARVSPGTGNRLTTRYSYLPSSGELSGIDYDDATPDVAFTLDRIGRYTAITDATGIRTFTYNNALQLASELINSTGDTQIAISRQYDALGRNTGFSAGTDYQIQYGYSTLGQFATLSSVVAGRSNSWSYAYLPNTDLISGWAEAAGNASVSRIYEANRDLLAAVSNSMHATHLSSFTYRNDALARRTQRTDTTTAGQPITNNFNYNPRSELIAAIMGTNTYTHTYDPIGNRIDTTNNANPVAYLANALNQYTNISDGALHIPRYDADGNLTQYDAWTFTWDAENRLITASNASTVISYQYDYMFRRSAKTSAGTTNRFVYDNWAMIQETSGPLTNRYVWGLDLSGSLQGAGTIGGLLGAHLNSTTVFYGYDANGNVTDLVDTNGNCVAHYEYDPFGRIIAKNGLLSLANPFRFSTRFADDDTGLAYYGFRYYAPQWGRWLSRDILEEEAGRNLYGFVDNDPLNRVDLLGLWAFTDHGPLTTQSYNDAFPNIPPSLKACSDSVLQWLNYWNLQQDFNRAHFAESQRHFNRKIDNPTGSGVGDARKAYTTYLTAEMQRFTTALQDPMPTLQQCRDALNAAGRLSHTWQDYYAHSVVLQNNGHTHTLWTANPAITGSPDKTAGTAGSIAPSSWNDSNNTGEHGDSWFEDLSETERPARMTAARQYVATRFRPLLYAWSQKCLCHCRNL